VWNWVLGDWRSVGYVALTTVMIYFSTVVALRFGERRTLAEMTPYDFVVAVAIGAVVGRTATAEHPSYVQSIVAVVALLVAHGLVSWLRLRSRRVRRLLERPPRVLVWRGAVCDDALRQSHMDRSDLDTLLREHGIVTLADVAAVVLETRGVVSVITNRDGERADLLLDLTTGRGPG
jgi:uncharacterized membrane protein YcaP (DUF421 family)